ncbi:MAG: putative Ig domain-containing protein, partial [Gammaproteobacteria bacterium]
LFRGHVAKRGFAMAARNTLNAGLSTLALALLLGVAGCGSDDERGGGTMATILENIVFDSAFSGSVGDGPITGARLQIFASNGELLMATDSSVTADYNVTIKTKGKNYPLTIESEGGIDIVTNMEPDFDLVAALIRPSKRGIGNLNPFTTLVVGAAKHSGGINDTTFSAARSAVVDRYGFGLDKSIIPDPTETPINESTVHVIVKTSETLGEMVRRTRDALYASGGSLDGNGIMNALAADLSDGWIDGKGAAGHDPRVAAVAHIASAAVLVQAMANRLHVNGYDATGAMDSAILQIRPAAPATSSTANVPVPAEALQQAIRSLQAARVLSDDSRLVKLIEVLRSVSPGAFPADLASRLAADIDPLLEELAFTAAYASDSQLAQINAAASREDGTSPAEKTVPPVEEPPPAPREEPTPPPEEPAPPPEEPAPAPAPVNNLPLISGTPAAAVLVGQTWAFAPTASDPDGDRLSFSISNKPAWLSFDPATGRTWGTPADKDVGTHSFITITVSDGQASVSLDPFSVAVSAPPPVIGHATVSWTPPTERTDGSPLTDLSGFKVYYGKATTSMTNVVDVQDPTQTRQLIENLDAGTWYFAVTAYDNENFESAKSAVASKTIS